MIADEIRAPSPRPKYKIRELNSQDLGPVRSIVDVPEILEAQEIDGYEILCCGTIGVQFCIVYRRLDP